MNPSQPWIWCSLCFLALVWGCSGNAPPQVMLPEFDRAQVSEPVQKKLKELEQALREEPSASRWAELGEFYWAHFANSQARDCMTRALKLEPDVFSRRYYLAVLCEETDWEQAAAHYRLAEKTRDDYAPSLVRFGNLLLQLDQVDAARTRFQKARKLDAGSPYPLLGLARVAAAQGDQESAQRLLKEASRLGPRSRQVWEALARRLQQDGRLEEALDAQRMAARLPEDEAGMDDQLLARIQRLEVVARRDAMDADRLLMTGRLPEAARAYQSLIEDNPDWSRARIGLAQCLLGMGSLTAARSVLDSAIATFPDEVDAYELLAAVCEAETKNDEAMTWYAKAVQMQPSRTSSHFAMGLLYEKKQDLPRAIASYRLAVSASPEFAPAQLSLGAALMQQDDPEAAIPFIRNAVRLAPGDPLPQKFLDRAEKIRAEKIRAQETKPGKTRDAGGRDPPDAPSESGASIEWKASESGRPETVRRARNRGIERTMA